MAGVNLYLTVFLTGLAGRIGWLPVSGDMEVIGILGHPVVMTVAAALYLVETVVDKIPVMDSLWDVLHTVIRPAGAVILTLNIVRPADPGHQVLAGILGGAAGLTFHLAKAAVRLRINNSPGPMANILASIVEDLVVAGLFALSVHQPLAGLVTCLTFLAVLWLLSPRMFRAVRASLFLMWKKMRLPAGVTAGRVRLQGKVTAEQDILIDGELPGTSTIEWATRCISGRVRRLPGLKPNTFGLLAGVKEHPGTLVFLGRRWFRLRAVKVPLTECESQHESRFLSEDLVIYNKSQKQQIVFRFTRAEEAMAVRLEAELHSQRKRAKAALPEPEAGPLAFIGIKERSPAREDVFLPEVFAEAPPRESPVFAPVSAVPGTPPFQSAPISPFPASTDAIATLPAIPLLTELPVSADVPPMPPTEAGIER